MTKDRRPPDKTVLGKMADALAHRGPDGRGEYFANNVGLVQRRLAIIDLETGDQPLYGPRGTAVVANAEIYNYVELWHDFADTRFATRSDCEPLLHLYARHGSNFAKHLRGMYAIALHDPSDGRLLLVRDPFGIKPLYYIETPVGLAFASEIQALAAAGLARPALNAAARAALLQLQYTTGRETVFAEVNRVLPGETLVVRDGRVVERLRRPALPDHGVAGWSEAEAIARLEDALTGSVKVHQRSDVPYGMFLSGGIDSSALLALMAQLNDRPVRAYTAGFAGGQVHDERARARAVAQAVGAAAVEVEFDEHDFWTLLPRIAASMDDPAADYATLPTYKLAAAARQDGLKVILCGEGGDELFAGYGRYRSAMRPWWQGGRRMRARGIFDGLGVIRHGLSGWRDGVTAAEATATVKGRSRLQVAQATDCADWLPNDLLTKLDRCMMAHGVEGRTPYLDPEVAEVAFRLPDEFKVRGRLGKWLLRGWLDRRLPGVDAFSRKRGFTVPVAAWIVARGKTLGPLVAAQPGVAELCDAAAVTGLFQSRRKRAGIAAWTLLFYALWHNRHVLGRPQADDVFETLAA